MRGKALRRLNNCFLEDQGFRDKIDQVIRSYCQETDNGEPTATVLCEAEKVMIHSKMSSAT